LSDRAYHALIMAASVDDLRAAIGDYPALLEPWADSDLSARAEAALDAGDERFAVEIEERREALAALRETLAGQEALPLAITALLQADGDDALAEALNEHPILLTDAAQQALGELAESARRRADEQLAAFAAERSAMLRKIRKGLEAG
ncbi:MAG TPA: hypothetical protein VFT99_12245, partial [Roseiflexaceae bacterium]|nr:hypothetical protein [Roseiflexaceae bacterium]